MKTLMQIKLARAYGMCFGVRDALATAEAAAAAGPVTVLGEIVHNPLAAARLGRMGAARGRLDDLQSASTSRVLVTAHGASDADKGRWRHAGREVLDTTCPLVRRAHAALRALVAEGCRPVVIGQRGHAEVRGLVGDFPGATVLESEADIPRLPLGVPLGVVSQTTQTVSHVRAILEAVLRERPGQEVRFRDTVCQPTKDRQEALAELCSGVELVIVVGGRHSNNTRQLAAAARARGCRAEQVEGADELQACWFRDVERVGVSAGTSTLEETVREVVARLEAFARSKGYGMLEGVAR